MMVDVYYTETASRSPAARVQGQPRPTFSGTNTSGPRPATATTSFEAADGPVAAGQEGWDDVEKQRGV